MKQVLYLGRDLLSILLMLMIEYECKHYHLYLMIRMNLLNLCYQRILMNLCYQMILHYL